ncbi:MAG: hypothetical protein RIK87_02940 [Fuerstiella sp.]
MWCPHCQSETTSSTASADVRCDNCGRTLSSGPAADARSQHASVQHARDILARWSSEDLLDRISALPQIPPLPGMRRTEAKATESTESTESTSAASDGPAPAAAVERKSIAPADKEDSEGTLPKSSTIDLPDPDDRRKSSQEHQTPADVATAGEVGGATKTDADDTSAHTQAANLPESPARTDSPEPDTEVPELRDQNQIQTDVEPPQLCPMLPSEQPAGAETDDSHGKTEPAASVTVPSEENTDQTKTEHSRTGTVPDKDTAAVAGNDTSTVGRTQAKTGDTDAAEQPVRPGTQSRSKQQRRHARRRQRDRKTSLNDAQEGLQPVTSKHRVDLRQPEAQDASVDSSAEPSGEKKIRGNSPKGGRRFRVDHGEPVEDTLRTGDGRGRTETRHHTRYIDEAHEEKLRGPHFQVTSPKRSNLTSLMGQVLAYLGVLGLTIGTAIVIYGHFGGYAEYTPTGWLVTTVAQMMLFLGVINLVSGGMEQNNDEVSARINHLGEQLLRIEQATEQALRGPKISARRYADPEAEPQEKEPAVVRVGERH